jgi:hypothetical protein
MTNIFAFNKENFNYISKVNKNIEKSFNEDVNNVFD